MINIAILLKLMNIFTHNCHNIVAHVSFFSDHEKLAEFYDKYDEDYDDVIERYIGINGVESIDLIEINNAANNALSNYPIDYKSNRDCFRILLELEQKLCMFIEEEISTVKHSEGTKQLLGEICNQSEKRQYLIKRRLG